MKDSGIVPNLKTRWGYFPKIDPAATATGAEETPTEGHLMIQFKILSEVQHDQS